VSTWNTAFRARGKVRQEATKHGLIACAKVSAHQVEGRERSRALDMRENETDCVLFYGHMAMEGIFPAVRTRRYLFGTIWDACILWWMVNWFLKIKTWLTIRYIMHKIVYAVKATLYVPDHFFVTLGWVLFLVSLNSIPTPSWLKSEVFFGLEYKKEGSCFALRHLRWNQEIS